MRTVPTLTWRALGAKTHGVGSEGGRHQGVLLVGDAADLHEHGSNAIGTGAAVRGGFNPGRETAAAPGPGDQVLADQERRGSPLRRARASCGHAP